MITSHLGLMSELDEMAASDFEFPVWCSARRSFLPDHTFFNAGNVERELLAKQVSLNISAEEQAYISRIEDDESWLVNCPIVGCGAKLCGLEDLETHYVTRHTVTCTVCSYVYPTKRLLSLHISETHDSFFQAKVARNYPMYECLVEGCSGHFQSDKARHQHLIDKHKFPRAFQFHRQKHHPSQKQRHRLQSKHHIPVKQVDEDVSKMDVEIDQLASGISRLSTADGKIPETISFGRRHNKVMNVRRKPELQPS